MPKSFPARGEKKSSGERREEESPRFTELMGPNHHGQIVGMNVIQIRLADQLVGMVAEVFTRLQIEMNQFALQIQTKGKFFQQDFLLDEESAVRRLHLHDRHQIFLLLVDGVLLSLH